MSNRGHSGRISNAELACIQAQAQLRNRLTPDATPTVNGFGANVGTMAAAIIAAAGTTLCNPAGRISCETDYLAISGATFPADVPREELEAFNRRTLRDVMSEADERLRYAAIAEFWRYGHV